MIKKYDEFLLEFNRKDINIITSSEISDQFTIAFEIEMETEDDSITPPTFIDDQTLIGQIREKLFSKLKNKKLEYFNKLSFIENILSKLHFDDDDQVLEGILNWNIYQDNLESIIVYYISLSFQEVYDSMEIEVNKIDNRSTKDGNFLKILKNNIKEYLPKFYMKYYDSIDFVLDMTLDKGIEIKQKTYIKGINNAIEFLNDFFQEFDNQEYWKFTEKTGIHINIGINRGNIEWNIIKGVILLKDLKKDDIPFVFKDMIWRMNTRFTNSILSELEIDKSKIDLSDIKKSEDYINLHIEKVFEKHGSKYFGFNIARIKSDNYVEFRYVGGEVDKELIEYKMLYFCYITYLMTHENYKRKEYLKALYKFVDE